MVTGILSPQRTEPGLYCTRDRDIRFARRVAFVKAAPALSPFSGSVLRRLPHGVGDAAHETPATHDAVDDPIGSLCSADRRVRRRPLRAAASWYRQRPTHRARGDPFLR